MKVITLLSLLVFFAVSSYATEPTTTPSDIEKLYGAAWNGDVKALAALQAKAEKGDAHAENYLGVMYQHGWSVKQDYTAAVKWFRLAAEQGFGEAQDSLWHFYFGGVGVPQDYEEAYFWATV